MNCKFCDTPLTREQTVCPTCGREVAGHKPPDVRKESVHLPKGKQRIIFFGCLAVLLGLLGVIAWQSFRAGGPSEQTMRRPVVTCGDFQLSNTELGYYFWSEYFYFIENNADYLPATLDTKKPLQDQMYDEETTWYDYILTRALDTVRSTKAMNFEAEKAGFSPGEAYEASLQQVLDNFEGAARAGGFVTKDKQPDVRAYLADSYGEGATRESFEAYLRDSYLAAAYSDALYAEPVLSPEEISDYYDRFAADYEAEGLRKDTTLLRSLRTVLIAPAAPEDSQSWETAKASAENLYAAWQADSGTQADFAALADAHSARSAAPGGLLENVSPGDLSGDLADWAFAPQRKAGDSGVCKTDAGWAVAYFVGVSEQTAWQARAQEDLRKETYQNAFRTILSGYTFVVDESAISLATPTKLYSGDTENVVQSPTND